jgi:hypothetical protein
MKKFKSSPFGEEVDLDDLNTYNHLRKLMFEEIGYSFCYMNYWHKDIFDNKITSGKDQRKRVLALVKEFTKGENSNKHNLDWYKRQVFLFQNEIENMC